MSAAPIRFDDGAAYEQGMGIWSRLVGEVFLDWLAPPPNLSWVDVGCGNGAFTELLAARAAPGEINALDPSGAQLQFARGRPGLERATFQQGGAEALPYADHRFDAAVMALVIFFVPDPAKGVSEMARVVRPGGLVCAYAWEIPEGIPFRPMIAELGALGIAHPLPPNPKASRMGALQALWRGAGLERIETRAITVERRFPEFEDYWRAVTAMSATKPLLDAMSPADLDRLKQRVRGHLTAGPSGQVSFTGHANAIAGRVPG